ncbi:DinB family protein [Crateriforma conspicua]|uniref:Uncharacterized protein n=1 Tax=Crateriforma conspicua TaxID=2527996 RepID=A0A5C5Y3V8_9PLAN|nr:DinB family protein [Crateriforma conspicua]QDV63541.1 hypothetical protein Mal65_26850 [Crateriforma conspicua]TWT68955.1 hypothetical protein Pan14r_12390 [Crateriforma conspicua]
MFTRERTNNEFQLDHFAKVSRDLTEDSLFEHFPGHGHSPAWILGHLAICAELGQHMLGGSLTHPEWVERFGPNSVDTGKPDAILSLSLMTNAVIDGYRDLRAMAGSVTDNSRLDSPHGVPVLTGTQIVSVADMIALLLTNHFAFHLSQLSSCRRSAGHAALF